MVRRMPLIYWGTVAIAVAVVLGTYFGVREQARQASDARHVAIEQSEARSAVHYCSNWRTDASQFADCSEALSVYTKCERARLSMLEANGDLASAGVYCEHPIYRFHAQEKREIDDATRAAANASRPSR